MPLHFVRNDIVKMKTDAIVNAANSHLAAGSGVCGAIFAAAGHADMQAACKAIGHCDTGSAVITPGFRLRAKYVIHAVGPIWMGGGYHEEALLAGAYRTALRLAETNGCGSISFPLISAGVYGYPREEALRVAVDAISAFLADHEMEVYLVLFDRASFSIGRKRTDDIQSYIDDHYTDFAGRNRRRDRLERRAQLVEQIFMAEEPHSVDSAPSAYESFEDTFPTFSAPQAMPMEPAKAPKSKPFMGFRKERTLDELVDNLEESFSKMLLRLIDEKGMTDVEAYKRANVDRKLFSKIRNNPAYNPSKATAFAFAIALRLNLDETRDLLQKAGYSISHSSKFDVIIEYFISLGNYNIYEINEALFSFDQKLLGA